MFAKHSATTAARCHLPSVMERLESREFMSAAHPLVHAAPAPAAPHAVEAAASPYPNCVGNWTGTATGTATSTVYHFTVKFTRQAGVSLTGTFSLGSLVGGNVLTTATIGLSPTFMVQVQGPTATASFIGALAENGKYITGRWSVLSNKGAWIVGTFTMTRP
jgi:hypothetical protein